MNKILFFGAGVLGSLYAARLRTSGKEVTILARGHRFDEILEHGIYLEDALNGRRENIQVPVVAELKPDDTYDLIVVLVRKNQLAGVLPVLSLNQATPHVLFMINNPSGYAEWISAVGSNRLLLGFAGAGGTKDGQIIRYRIVPRFLQPTTFGELDGSKTPRLKEIKQIFESAGFPAETTSNMDAWQKSHVAWVSPLCNAIYMANGDNRRLAKNAAALHLLVRAINEGFQGLRAAGIPITPKKLGFLERIPEDLLIELLRLWITTRHFKTVIAAHAMAAPDEMRQIADEFRGLLRRYTPETPAIDALRSYNQAAMQGQYNGSNLEL